MMKKVDNATVDAKGFDYDIITGVYHIQKDKKELNYRISSCDNIAYYVLPQEGRSPNLTSQYLIEIKKTSPDNYLKLYAQRLCGIFDRQGMVTSNLRNINNENKLESSSIALSDKKQDEVKEEKLINRISFEIKTTILNDVFEDGEISNSVRLMNTLCQEYSLSYVKSAIMKLYTDYYGDPDAEQIMTGILAMISSQSYSRMNPEGQIMSLALLQHKSLYIRDKAIQAFETWKSKQGIKILRGLKCDQKWLQEYVDEVIEYLEEVGE